MARVTKKVKDAFINQLHEGHSVRAACRFVNVSKTTMYNHRDKDPSFKQRWDDACEAGIGLIEDELKDRILEGEPVFNREGEIIGYRKSDRLLEFMLRARDPDTYAERRRTEVTGADGGPIQSESLVSEMTPEERKQRKRYLKELLGKKEVVGD